MWQIVLLDANVNLSISFFIMCLWKHAMKAFMSSDHFVEIWCMALFFIFLSHDVLVPGLWLHIRGYILGNYGLVIETKANLDWGLKVFLKVSCYKDFKELTDFPLCSIRLLDTIYNEYILIVKSITISGKGYILAFPFCSNWQQF